MTKLLAQYYYSNGASLYISSEFKYQINKTQKNK